MKILWLVSWYPNKHDAFEGDFIQRHAQAAALYNDIAVLYVNQSGKNKEITAETNSSGRLTETRIYLPLGNVASLLKKLIKQKQYQLAFRNAVDGYISRQGIPDLVHVHIPMRAGITGVWVKRKYGLPLIVSEHWGIYGNTRHDDIRRKQFPYRVILKRIINKADKLITVSTYLGGTINNAGISKPFHVIPNCVNTQLFNTAGRTSHSKFRFLHVSNLLAVKNPQMMLDAIQMFFEKGKDAEFVFIGNADDKWEKLVSQKGLERKVIFKGLLPHESVAAEMKKADALFLYSDFETFSCVTAEALCSGLPVISAETGAAPELLNETNGLLVNPANPPALADSFIRMLDYSSSFDKDKIASAASSLYCNEHAGKMFDDVYKTVKKQINLSAY